MLTEDRGALPRDSPKRTTSCGVSVEEASGRDPPKKALRGFGVDDGGGRGVAVDDWGWGLPTIRHNDQRVREVRCLAFVSLQLVDS